MYLTNEKKALNPFHIAFLNTPEHPWTEFEGLTKRHGVGKRWGVSSVEQRRVAHVAFMAHPPCNGFLVKYLSGDVRFLDQRGSCGLSFARKLVKMTE